MTHSVSYLRLIQQNGRPADWLWEIPPQGGGLDALIPVGHEQVLGFMLPTDFELHTIQCMPVHQQNPGDLPFWWLLNMQNTLVCAINQLLLRPNSKQAFGEADCLQLGTLEFRFERHLHSVIPVLTLPEDSIPKHSPYDVAADMVAIGKIEPFLLEASTPPLPETPAPESVAPASPAQPLENFSWEELERSLGDAGTEQSLQGIALEKSDAIASDAQQVQRQAQQQALQAERSALADAEIEQMAREDDLMDALHAEYLLVLQDPKQLQAHGDMSAATRQVGNEREELQNLMDQGAEYDSLHDLLGRPQDINQIMQDMDDLGNYDILAPEPSANVLQLFAPAHLHKASAVPAGEGYEQDVLKGLLALEEGGTSSLFSDLPLLNQREHHSAVVASMIDLRRGEPPPSTP